MKSTLLALIVSTSLFASDEPFHKEEWSDTVDGVRARLVIDYDPDIFGVEMAVVRLELQNVSDVGSPKELWFDTLRSQFRWQLLDERGNPVAENDFTVASIRTPPPYWITLPYDSTLRFRVSVRGYGIRPNSGVALQLPGAFWQVPRKKEGGYYLSATFSSVPPKEEGRRVWNGTLTLPKVALPGKLE